MEVQSLALLANMLAHKFNINVKSEGSEANCVWEPRDNSTTITVPAFVADSDADRVYVRGYIDHEIGHARFTDWNAYDYAVSSNKAVHRIANIFEDVYVERMMGRCYPGCALNLAAMQKQLFVTDRTYETSTVPKSGDGKMLWYIFRYILYRARNIQDLLPTAEHELESVCFGLPKKIDDLLSVELQKCSSTKDNIKLALRVKDLISYYLREQAQNEHEMQEIIDKITAEVLDGNTKDCSTETTNFLGSVLNDIINNGAGDKLTESSCRVDANETHNFMRSIPGLKNSNEALDKMPPQLIAKAQGCAAALSAQLQSLMQAKVLRKRRVGMQGRLDTNRLHRLSTGNANVFLRNNEVRQVNTQVILLGDTSGSMYDTKDLASEAIYSVVSALRNIHGVSSAAYGFGDNTLSTMCDFNTPLYQGSMYIRHPNGGTPGGSALQLAIQKFDLTKTEQRKILFFITDGDFQQVQRILFKAVYKEAKEVGIDVIGIGIGTDRVKNLWNGGDFFVINDIKELAPKLFDILKTRLV